MANKRVVITGGTGLIGRALIAKFQEAEWSVFAPGRSEFDLSQPGDAQRLIAAAGKFDLLVNNAADQSVIDIAGYESVTSHEAIHRQFQTNVFAPLEAMIAAHRIGASACINISSIEAVTPRGGHEIYGSSKASLEALTKSLSVALAPMRINGIRLGLVGDASLVDRWPEGVASWKRAVPAGRYASADEVADFIYAIAGEQFSFTTGAIFDFDGGKSASPGW